MRRSDGQGGGDRDEIERAADLHERVVEALSVDHDGDGFELAATVPEVLGRQSRARHLADERCRRALWPELRYSQARAFK